MIGRASEGFIAGFALLIFVVMALSAGHMPVHWDEGWNLCAAKGWSSYDHFGCDLNGKRGSPNMTTGIWPVYLSKIMFDLSGPEYRMARIPFAIAALLTIFLLFHVTKQIYGSFAAYISVFLYVFISADPRINILLLASQGFAEALLGFILMASVLVALIAFRAEAKLKKLGLLIVLFLLMSVLWQLKKQALPFLLCAAAGSIIFMCFSRRITAGVCTFVVVGLSFFVSQNFQFIHTPMSDGELDYSGALAEGIVGALALNFDYGIRLQILEFFLTYFWILIPVAGYVLWSAWFGKRDFLGQRSCFQPVSVFLILAAASWTIWFLGAAINFPRYYSIAFLLAMPIAGYVVSRILSSLTTHSIGSSFIALAELRGGLTRTALVLVPSVWIAIQVLLSVYTLTFTAWGMRERNIALEETANFLNQNFPQSYLLESYDTQLFHLVDMSFTYPSAQFHVDSIRSDSARRKKNSYDWSAKRPDLVVVGEWSRIVFGLYGEIENHEAYELLHENQHYKTYVRKTQVE